MIVESPPYAVPPSAMDHLYSHLTLIQMLVNGFVHSSVMVEGPRVCLSPLLVRPRPSLLHLHNNWLLGNIESVILFSRSKLSLKRCGL